MKWLWNVTTWSVGEAAPSQALPLTIPADSSLFLQRAVSAYPRASSTGPSSLAFNSLVITAHNMLVDKLLFYQYFILKTSFSMMLLSLNSGTLFPCHVSMHLGLSSNRCVWESKQPHPWGLRGCYFFSSFLRHLKGFHKMERNFTGLCLFSVCVCSATAPCKWLIWGCI